MTDDKNYAKLVQITGYPIKGHKYRLDLILPSKIPQEQLVKKTGLDDQKWSLESDRYLEILEYYLSSMMDDLQHDLDIGSWQIKQVDYKPDKFMKEWMDVFEVKTKKPVKFVFYFYTQKPLKVQKTVNIIRDSIIHFHSDYLCTFPDFKKLKELPKEFKRKTLMKIPLTKLLNEMEKGDNSCEEMGLGK